MDDGYSRKWKFLSSYAAQKMKLRRLRQQREEYIVLRGKGNDLGTTIQQGMTADTTGDAAVKMIENIDRTNEKIRDVYKALAAVTDYIERAPICETDKLILICKFIRGMQPERICEELEEPFCGRAAMRKRIKRIVAKLPEIKNTPSK